MKVTPGSTDVTTYFVLRLTATGVEATGLTITDFDLQYTRSGAAPVAKVDATALATTSSAHSDNTAIEIDATDQPGLYRVDWPDAAFVVNAREVILSVKVATCFTEHLRVELEFIQGGDSFARLGAPVGASISGDIQAIETLTDEIETRLGTPSNLGGGATISANLADIEAQTDDIAGGVTVAAGGISASAFVAGAIDAAAIAANAIGASELAADAVTEIQSGLATAASIAALNNLSAAAVNAEVVDALSVDSYAEASQGTPAATASLAAKLGFLYKAWRNKATQTATEYNLYGDDALTVDHKAAVSDDGTTFTKGETATGA